MPSKKIDVSWGATTRMELINKVISQMGYGSYLEIGCNQNKCFNQINAKIKVGVDPKSGGTHRMTSDGFFAQNTQSFDCIFIDGLHYYSQVLRDITNSMKCLNEGGTIIVHDCLPLNYWAQFTKIRLVQEWNGDTWKAFVEARTWRDADAALCMIDHGNGIIRKRANTAPLALGTNDFASLSFDDLVENHTLWMRPIDFADVMGFIKAK